MDAKLKKIKLIISDVDGVLTDGRIYLLGREEIKSFSVRDASPIEMAQRSGIKFMLFTSRKSEAIKKRAEEMGTDLVFKTDVKAAGGDIVAFVKEKYGVSADEVLYVGDDWSDLYVMTTFGVAVAPSNAAPENLAVADIVTKAAGGQGVLREIVQTVMLAQGTWDTYLAEYKKTLSP